MEEHALADSIFDNNDVFIEMSARITPQWVAGFFDGEGSILIARPESGPRCSVMIGQNDPLPILLIALKYNGAFSSFKVKNPSGKVTTHHRVRIEVKEDTKRFLLSIKDFVVVKRKQVEAALKMVDLMLSCHETWASVPKDMIAQREELANQIQASNRRFGAK